MSMRSMPLAVAAFAAVFSSDVEALKLSLTLTSSSGAGVADHIKTAELQSLAYKKTVGADGKVTFPLKNEAKGLGEGDLSKMKSRYEQLKSAALENFTNDGDRDKSDKAGEYVKVVVCSTNRVGKKVCNFKFIHILEVPKVYRKPELSETGEELEGQWVFTPEGLEKYVEKRWTEAMELLEVADGDWVVETKKVVAGFGEGKWRIQTSSVSGNGKYLEKAPVAQVLGKRKLR